jgi:hypothetical protein
MLPQRCTVGVTRTGWGVIASCRKFLQRAQNQRERVWKILQVWTKVIQLWPTWKASQRQMGRNRLKVSQRQMGRNRLQASQRQMSRNRLKASQRQMGRNRLKASPRQMGRNRLKASQRQRGRNRLQASQRQMGRNRLKASQRRRTVHLQKKQSQRESMPESRQVWTRKTRQPPTRKLQLTMRRSAMKAIGQRLMWKAGLQKRQSRRDLMQRIHPR